MISLKQYQEALKIVDDYRRQQCIKEGLIVEPNVYAEMNIYHIAIPKAMLFYLELIAKYELPESLPFNNKVKHFAGLSKDRLLQYRNFGKRKLEILEHHLALAGLHLEP